MHSARDKQAIFSGSVSYAVDEPYLQKSLVSFG
jgi:hypothetical protein